jgi:ankyrin repeat protein
MKLRTILSLPILIMLLFAIVSPARAQTNNSDFQQTVAAYQQSPSHDAAEKVIRLASAMDQLPPISEEARKHFVRGAALFKDAKSPGDYKQVVDEFKQATHLAPWWPETRYNLALALEAEGNYDKAIANVKLYLLFKLPETDVRGAQDKIYALEAKQQKAKEKVDANKEMWDAIRSDNGNVVRATVDRGADPNDSPYHGFTALTAACKNGYANAALALIDKGADVNLNEPVHQGYVGAGDKTALMGGETPLMFAATFPSVDVVRALIGKHVNINARNAYGETALRLAISAPDGGFTAESAAKRKRDKGEVIQILREAGATE